MLAIFKRELRGFFVSPIGYAFLFFFLLLSGLFFILSNLYSASTQMGMFFSNLITILLFLIPILTMRILSEEKKSKTDQLLITSPVNIYEIILGKYLATIAVFLISIVITFVYPVILFIFGKPDAAPIVGLYAGYFLLGCAFISIGMFISSLTENQVISAISTFAVLLVMWMLDWMASAIQVPALSAILEWLSPLRRFNDFTLGILNFEPVVFYISISVIFVYLTVRVLEKRRFI